MSGAPGVGATDRATRTIRQADLDAFARLSGDDNPIHTDPRAAAEGPFGVTVAHGMLLYGLVRARLRRWLPGARQVDQRLVFPAPAPVGTTVTIRLEVLGADGPARHVATSVVRDDGRTCLEGDSRLELAP